MCLRLQSPRGGRAAGQPLTIGKQASGHTQPAPQRVAAMALEPGALTASAPAV